MYFLKQYKILNCIEVFQDTCTLQGHSNSNINIKFKYDILRGKSQLTSTSITPHIQFTEPPYYKPINKGNIDPCQILLLLPSDDMKKAINK